MMWLVDERICRSKRRTLTVQQTDAALGPASLAGIDALRSTRRIPRLAPCTRLREQSAKADFGPWLPRIHSPRHG
jgi:hypothetical protein